MDASLPPLKNFILPSGGLAASTLHIGKKSCFLNRIFSKDCLQKIWEEFDPSVQGRADRTASLPVHKQAQRLPLYSRQVLCSFRGEARNYLQESKEGAN